MNKNLLRQLEEISLNHNLNEFRENMIKSIEEVEISIALLGEFSSGKSTLANVFLGKKLLPALDKPTTASIVEITSGDNLQGFIVTDNDIQEIKLSELGDFIMGEKSKDIKKVLLKVQENEFIKKGIKIIDTPGISSINSVHDDNTLDRF